MAQTRETSDLYSTLARAMYLAAGLVLAFWFLDAVTLTLLLFAFATIIAIALNPPVTWLEERKVPRVAAALLVCLGIALLLGFLGWLVVPRLADQVSALWESLPGYFDSLMERVTQLLPGDSRLEELLRLDGDSFRRLIPSIQTALVRVGRLSLSLVGLLLFGIILISTVVYLLANPRPLLRGLFEALPPHHRDPAFRALSKGSDSEVGWIRANLIVGTVEAVASALFLSFLGVPGALVWATLAFFAELVPKLGPYLMSIPPTLVALAVDPMMGLWVLLFYMALNELTSDFIAPLARSSQMDLHPVSLIFAVLALASLFGFMGALLSTPLTGFAKAFYEEFYLARQPEDQRVEERVDAVLHRRTTLSPEGPEGEGQGNGKETQG